MRYFLFYNRHSIHHININLGLLTVNYVGLAFIHILKEDKTLVYTFGSWLLKKQNYALIDLSSKRILSDWSGRVSNAADTAANVLALHIKLCFTFSNGPYNIQCKIKLYSSKL